MKTPNFFIVGAPKCGTTALTFYLGDHANIFISNPKEPFYWCLESPGLKSYTRIQTLADYEHLFAAATDQHIAVGEGSTEYLRSPHAIPEILNYNPQAKFIALLRNPVELVYSFHGTQLFTLSEDESDFEQAWRLQEQRERGEHLPPACLDPRLLMYRQVGCLGSQLERFYDLVPESQRRVILFDDFAADTRQVYEQILAFLNVPTDHRTDFPKIHEARKQRFPWIHRLVRRPPKVLAGPVMAVRRMLNECKTGLIPAVKQVFSQKSSRASLSPTFRKELNNEFRKEIQVLSRLLNRDLNHWH